MLFSRLFKLAALATPLLSRKFKLATLLSMPVVRENAVKLGKFAWQQYGKKAVGQGGKKP